jgi:hypothetical protein
MAVFGRDAFDFGLPIMKGLMVCCASEPTSASQGRYVSSQDSPEVVAMHRISGQVALSRRSSGFPG